jgi:hypothetical protein
MLRDARLPSSGFEDQLTDAGWAAYQCLQDLKAHWVCHGSQHLCHLTIFLHLICLLSLWTDTIQYLECI